MIEEERVIIHEKVKLFLAKRQSPNNNCSFQCPENLKYTHVQKCSLVHISALECLLSI